MHILLKNVNMYSSCNFADLVLLYVQMRLEDRFPGVGFLPCLLRAVPRDALRLEEPHEI